VRLVVARKRGKTLEQRAALLILEPIFEAGLCRRGIKRCATQN